jgi:hypothetical protein
VGEEDRLHCSYFLKLKNGDLRSQGGSEALNFATLFQDKVEDNSIINGAYKTKNQSPLHTCQQRSTFFLNHNRYIGSCSKA